ncbi:MAG: serine/threonine protein kinase, partial [Planctomycetota bacterium]
MSSLDPIECMSLEQIEIYLDSGDTCRETAEHLAACETCRRRMGEVKRNNALFSSVLEATEADVDGLGHGVDGVAISGYQVLEEIHRGAQGVVYKAFHEGTRRHVALKVILQGGLATSRQRERFRREIELIAALDHPGIVTVYDNGVTGSGHSYYSMKLVDGLPLDEFLATRNEQEQTHRASIRFRLTLMRDICRAVNHAHQHGIIHRDLKPSNILVDAQGQPHVVDFGLAKEVSVNDRLVTVDDGFLGTLAYASPEQASGRQDLVDIRSDVYSLGVIFYQMLTGVFPYSIDGALSEVLRRIEQEAPSRPSQVSMVDSLSPYIDRDLETMVLTALAKGKERRYQSAGLLAADLERYLEGKAIDARRDSTWYVLTKLGFRYKWRLGLAFVLSVATVVTAVVMAVLYQRSIVEAEKTRQIKVFLEDTLATVEAPDGGDVQMRDVLDDAARWVDIALRDQPEVEAALRMTIGNSYRALGEFDLADEHLSAALESRRKLFGTEHPEFAASLNTMALLAKDRGALKEAEGLFRKALTIRERSLGSDHPSVASNLQNLGNLLLALGQIGEALECFENALRIRIDTYGSTHPDVAMVRINLARAYRQTEPFPSENVNQANVNRARWEYREALRVRRATLAAIHPDLAGGLLEFGEFLLQHGNPGEAETP